MEELKMTFKKPKSIFALSILVLFLCPTFVGAIIIDIPVPEWNDITVSGDVDSYYAGMSMSGVTIRIIEQMYIDGSLYKNEITRTTTNSDGEYSVSFSVLSDRMITVKASKSGYYTTSKSVRNKDGSYVRDFSLVYKNPKKFAFFIWTSPFIIQLPFDQTLDVTDLMRDGVNAIKDVFDSTLNFDYTKILENPQDWDDSIRDYLDNNNLKITPEDYLFIGLIGHGEIGTGRFVLVDYGYISPTNVASFLKAEQVSGRIRTNNFFLHVDCCYSGNWIDDFPAAMQQQEGYGMDPMDYFILTSTTDSDETALFSLFYFGQVLKGADAYTAYTTLKIQSDILELDALMLELTFLVMDAGGLVIFDPQWLRRDASNCHTLQSNGFWYSTEFREY